MLIVKNSNFISVCFFYVSLKSEPRNDAGIYDILSGEGSYPFRSLVRSEERVSCWKSCGNWKPFLVTGRSHTMFGEQLISSQTSFLCCPLRRGQDFGGITERQDHCVEEDILKKFMGNLEVCVQNLDMSRGMPRNIYGLGIESCLREKYSWPKLNKAPSLNTVKEKEDRPRGSGKNSGLSKRFGLFRERTPRIFYLAFRSKLETCVVLWSDQVKTKNWWLDTSHAFVEILVERKRKKKALVNYWRNDNWRKKGTKTEKVCVGLNEKKSFPWNFTSFTLVKIRRRLMGNVRGGRR